MQPIVRVKPKKERNVSTASISSSPLAEPKKEVEKPARTFQEAAKRYSFQKVFSLEDWKQEDIIEWSSSNNPFRKEETQKPQKPWWHFLLSIVGAIAVGCIMGFSILEIFFQEPKKVSTVSIDSHLTKPSPNLKLTPPSPIQKKKPAHETKWALPSLPVVLLQVGKYDDKSQAQKTVQTYRTEGLAAFLSNSSPYQIYLGVGSTRDDALKLTQIIRQKEIEVTLKDFPIEGKGLGEKGKGVSQELIAAIQSGHELFQELAKLTVEAMPTDGSQVSTFAQGKDFLSRQQAFVTKVQEVNGKLPKESQQALMEMTRAVDLMVQSSTAAQKSPNTALLWQIQEGLLRYAFSYEKLLHTLK